MNFNELKYRWITTVYNSSIVWINKIGECEIEIVAHWKFPDFAMFDYGYGGSWKQGKKQASVQMPPDLQIMYLIKIHDILKEIY